jgi:Fe-S cluster biosynthesis and repair protein YggX
VAAQANHADQRAKAQHDERGASQAAGAGDGQFLFEGKDVHIEGYTPPENK